MREAALVLVAVAVCSASVLEFVTLPRTINIKSAKRELRLSDVPLLNENLLGLTAKPVSGFDVNGDLFTRPHAIAVFHVEGIESLDGKKYPAYKLETDRFDPSPLDKELASVFGVDREIVTVNKEGISGSEISKHSAEQKINEEIKTKVPVLRQELENVYRLAAAIASQGAKFEEKNTADVYRMKISGLTSTKLSPEDREMALKDLQNAVDKLTQALTKAYGDQVIVEVLALSEPVKSPSRHDEQMTLIRRKRAADTTETDTNLKTWRESLNVYVFTSTDYPAMFAIFAGLVIALVLAVLYTVVGMMSMDPSRDSIIYRMTTTRMKKA